MRNNSLEEHPEMCLEIENLVREHYGIEPKEFEFEEDGEYFIYSADKLKNNN